MKHLDDEEWSNFTYEQAMKEQDKRNERRVKRSLLLKSPEPQRDGVQLEKSTDPGTLKSRSGARVASSNFVPVKRKERVPSSSSTNESQRAETAGPSSKSTWRPPRKPASDFGLPME